MTQLYILTVDQTLLIVHRGFISVASKDLNKNHIEEVDSVLGFLMYTLSHDCCSSCDASELKIHTTEGRKTSRAETEPLSCCSAKRNHVAASESVSVRGCCWMSERLCV